MENIQTAPDITGIEQLYSRWKHTHPGATRIQFLHWLGTPSTERQLFLSQETETGYTVRNNVIIQQHEPNC